MTTRSTPERLDEAVESLLAGGRPAIEPQLRPLLEAAGALSRALRPVPASPRFESRLAERLTAGSGHRSRRLLAAGAFSSVAVGATVTAFAVWRSTRRHAPLQQRLLQR